MHSFMTSVLTTEHCGPLGNRCGAEQIGFCPGQLEGDADLCLQTDVGDLGSCLAHYQ